jgi:serine protease Do
MTKFRWYGPTFLLLITVLTVLLAGPPLARQLAYEYEDGKVVQIRNNLKQNESLADLSAAFKDVAKLVDKSVVSIETYSKQRTSLNGSRSPGDELRRFYFGPNSQSPVQPDRRNSEQEQFRDYDVPQQSGNGSGWVFDGNGHIITNNHVVENADRIVVRFYDGSQRDASIVGTDPKTDIAVIKVKGGLLHAAKLARNGVDKGEIVFAFGSPFGYEFSMSQGIVSAKGRRLGILRGKQGYENFIQTDAAINPGNSGGPLTNIYGEIVGMNTAIATRTQVHNGLGFAIPVSMVTNVVEQLIDGGKVRRGYLGVFIEDLTPQMAKTFGYDGKGVLVANPIKGSPADKAGLVRGDIITTLDGEPIESAEALRGTVAALKPGAKLKVQVYRLKSPTDMKGQTLDIEIKIGEMPTTLTRNTRVTPESGAGDKAVEANKQMLGKLGITVETASRDLARRAGVDFAAGVMVTNVRSSSAAAGSGFRPGHIITHVMGERIATAEDFVKLLNTKDLKKGVRISVVEAGSARYLFLGLPK